MIKALLTVVMVFIFTSIGAQTAIAPVGSGTSENPYQIQTLSNLYWLSQSTGSWGSNFIQTANIDASETSTWFPNGSGGYLGWSPIGGSGAQFTGLYHGQNYAIKGLYINRPSQDYVGLFGYCSNTQIVDGKLLVRNLILVDAQITGHDFVGSIAGYARGWNDSHIQYRGHIYRCHSIASVSGESAVGGLIGQLFKCNVAISYSSGMVSSSNYAGGLVGYHWSYCEIRNSYSTARVQNANRMGGLVGRMVDYASLYQCYSSGQVVGGSSTGGLVGFISDGEYTCSATDCFWDMDSSGKLTSAKGTGKTTVQMKSRSTFPASWLFSGDDIHWWMVDGQTRPVLRLEYSTNIRTPHQLQMMKVVLDASYQLIWDIDLSVVQNPADIWATGTGSEGGFVPIGSTTSRFTGALDGNSFSVSSLYINRTEVEYQSFLGNLSGAEISNLNLTDAYIKGSTYSAGLACQVENSSSIENSSFKGTVQTAWSFHGGLVAYLTSSSTVDYCFSEGLVDGGSWSGGLIGFMNNNASVSNSYSRSRVNGSIRVAGFVSSINNASVMNCYSTGYVNASGYPSGGFASETSGANTINGCFWDMTTSFEATSAGGDGVQGKTTAEMKTQSTFTDAGWDFNAVWLMRPALNDGYPILVWDYDAPAEPLAPLNIQISISGNDVLLAWDDVVSDVDGNPMVPDAYHIYYQLEGDPYGEFAYLGQSATNSFTHIAGSAMADRIFYYVSAVKD